MNRLILLSTLFLVAAPGSSLARPVHMIPFAEQLEKADLVVVAHPTSATVHKPGAMARPDGSIEVTTPFKVEAVIKGEYSVRRFTLLHHRYNDPDTHITIVDGPGYIRFAKNDERPCLMFLNKAESGEYVPYSGQYDPGVSIRHMVPPGPPGPARAEAASPDEETNAEKSDALSAYPSSPAFDANAQWHRHVGEQEIRMSYFSRGDTKVAMRCVADLSSYEVTTSREVHNHASQSIETRRLSHSQVQTIRAVRKRLTAPDEKPALENLLVVSFMLGNERRMLIFDATRPPPDVVRLYDLTGAYLPAALDAEESNPRPADKTGDEARLWHRNRITPEQPFPARVIGVIPSWVGYAPLLEEIAEKPRYCVAYLWKTQRLEYNIVPGIDAFKEVPEAKKATYLTPGVEVDAFSWSIGIWTIGRRFGEKDFVTESYPYWIKRADEPNAVDDRLGDLEALRAALQRGENLADLHGKFQLGTVVTGYYSEGIGTVGGRPTSRMTFFRDSDGNYYRIFGPKEIVLIDKPACWIPQTVDAGTSQTR